MTTKTCTSCSRELPEEEFAMRKEGYRRRQCNGCRSVVINNWHATNPDSKKRTNAKWRANNRSTMLALQLAWRDRNLERTKATQAAWRKNNPEAVRAAANRHRARKVEATIEEFSTADLRSYWLDAGIDPDQCFYCGGPHDHDDHIVPLARGGNHCRSNLAPACTRCNCSKGAKTVEEWLASQLNAPTA